MATVKKLEDPIVEYMKENRRPGCIAVADVVIQPPGIVMTEGFARNLERFKNFKVRPDDVWIISFPRSGTTWTQQMAWVLGNDLDFETAKSMSLFQRAPYFETVGLISDEQREAANPNDKNDWMLHTDTVDFVDKMASPRYIKTHIPASLLPDEIWTVKPKIIYITRNPKAVAVSYYHHYRLWVGYTGAFETFLQAFLQDKILYCPYWNHVIEYKKFENEPNVLINSYEEMAENLPGVIEKMAKFLGKEITVDQVNALANYLGFEKMKANNSLNRDEISDKVKERLGLDPTDPDLHFIRKGKVDSWKVEMTPDMVKQFDDWTTQKTKGTILDI